MSKIWYISPSNQSDNVGINGYGTEQEQMYLLADAITPHLDRCGISFHVADRDQTLASRAQEANTMDAAWYLALHSNAGGNGGAWGPIAFYHTSGKGLAEELIRQLEAIGQQSNRSSSVQQRTSLYELRAVTGTSCLLEVDFHDSAIGVEFITQRRAEIGEAIAKAIVNTEGRPWVPAPTGDEREEAIRLGLLEPGDWDRPITRREAAIALIRLKDLL